MLDSIINGVCTEIGDLLSFRLPPFEVVVFAASFALMVLGLVGMHS